MYATSLAVLAASLATVNCAIHKGFNYGATFSDGSFMAQSDFEGLFTSAKNLVGTSGFTSARLYTMIQGGTTSTPTTAIQAAIDTNTTLLLGLWASGDGFADELTALSASISQYGTSLTDLIVGISVGSEDLYRISPTGIENKDVGGAEPSTLVGRISQVRSAIKGTSAKDALVGHVDTWTAWVNASNNAVITASDFIGMDAYPYFENTLSNSIENGNATFWSAYDQTVAAVGKKPVYITETGWPVSGAASNQAIPSVENARKYWVEMGCAAFGHINTWWFTLQDAQPTTPNPSFGIVGAGIPPSSKPLYSLSC